MFFWSLGKEETCTEKVKPRSETKSNLIHQSFFNRKSLTEQSLLAVYYAWQFAQIWLADGVSAVLGVDDVGAFLVSGWLPRSWSMLVGLFSSRTLDWAGSGFGAGRFLAPGSWTVALSGLDLIASRRWMQFLLKCYYWLQPGNCEGQYAINRTTPSFQSLRGC